MQWTRPVAGQEEHAAPAWRERPWLAPLRRTTASVLDDLAEGVPRKALKDAAAFSADDGDLMTSRHSAIQRAHRHGTE